MTDKKLEKLYIYLRHDRGLFPPFVKPIYRDNNNFPSGQNPDGSSFAGSITNEVSRSGSGSASRFPDRAASEGSSKARPTGFVSERSGSSTDRIGRSQYLAVQKKDMIEEVTPSTPIQKNIYYPCEIISNIESSIELEGPRIDDGTQHYLPENNSPEEGINLMKYLRDNYSDKYSYIDALPDGEEDLGKLDLPPDIKDAVTIFNTYDTKPLVLNKTIYDFVRCKEDSDEFVILK